MLTLYCHTVPDFGFCSVFASAVQDGEGSEQPQGGRNPLLQCSSRVGQDSSQLTILPADLSYAWGSSVFRDYQVLHPSAQADAGGLSLSQAWET